MRERNKQSDDEGTLSERKKKRHEAEDGWRRLSVVALQTNLA